MNTRLGSRAQDVCPRCRLAIKLDSKRCAHCGERLIATSKYPLYVGIIGLLALLFVAFIMVKSIRREDLNTDTPPGGGPHVSQPAAPDKPPPLNK
jgi:hypothetical protein